MITLSIVIPTKDREEDLLKCVESISKQVVKPCEVLVVDDGQISEESKEKIAGMFSESGVPFRYFKKEIPCSAESKNLGVQGSKGDVVLFLDDDVILEKDFIKNMLAVWERKWDEKEVAGISGVITNSKRKSFAKIIFEKIFYLYSKKAWSILPWGFQTQNFDLKKEEIADWVPNGLASFRKEIFNICQFKTFQQGRVALEDFEFCWQLKDAGYYFYVTPFARLIHNESSIGREKAFTTGFKEGINRKILFKIHANKTFENYFYFGISAFGCICSLFLGGQYKKCFGMIRGYLKKDSSSDKFIKNKTKIVFFLPNLEAGGAERVTINLLKGLDKESHEISLVLAEKKGYFVNEVPKDISIFSFETSFLFILFFKLIRYFKKNNPDIFISVSPCFSIVSIVAKIFSGGNTKIIFIEHSVFSSTAGNARTLFRRTFAKFIFPTLMRIFYPNSQAIICVSNGVADDISRITKIDKNKIKVIYNPVIISEVRNLAKESVNHPWILEKNIPVILAVGRLVRAKDYPTLLKSFSIMLRTKQAKLLILGEGEKREELKLIASKLCIDNKVDFLGFEKNPYKYMSKSSVFVISSIQEGFPTVIIEAMACGVPVVSTNCKSGPDEIIEDGINGLLVPTQDENALAEAVLKLLDDKNLREKFSKEGENTSQKFSFERSIKEYENLFKELLK